MPGVCCGNFYSVYGMTMDELISRIIAILKEHFRNEFNKDLQDTEVQVQHTRREFDGDLSLVVFPLLGYTRKGPEETAEELGTVLKSRLTEIGAFNVIRGYLNLKLTTEYWIGILKKIDGYEQFGMKATGPDSKMIVIEFSSPNTNKPLHLGHIRNNLLGYSISKITAANGHKVKKVNIVNDRGIHICKSMLAWQWDREKTPETTGKKGDHLVGDFYVRFEQEYKKQVAELKEQGMNEKTALREAPVIREAQEMLRKWEAGDPEVMALWKKMNEWVYKGFGETYERLGVDFDKIDYESDTYKLGRDIILKGVKKKVLQKREDGSVWADLTGEGLDEKLLLRADGTSVYMTQDIGLANRRHSEYNFDRHIYVVGNEQNYHFQVLQLVLKKLGYDWADDLYHLSYGMVELPQGKMKSREGTVVDADDLMDEMNETARRMSEELGKLDGYSGEEKEEIIRIIGLGALKYFILKVDPKKNMVFDPVESVDFNGNTGPFIQYTYARIRSVMKKAGDDIPDAVSIDASLPINDKETELIKLHARFPETVAAAFDEFNPSLIANYTYELAREFNQFYHDHSILSAESDAIRDFRLVLAVNTGKVISQAFSLLGIEVPERM